MKLFLLLLLLAAPLQAKVYFFKDFKVDFPSEPSIRANAIETSVGLYTGNGYVYVVSKASAYGIAQFAGDNTDLGTVLNAFLNAQRIEAGEVNDAPVVWRHMTQGYPATSSAFYMMLNGKQVLCFALIIYALPVVYIVKFYTEEFFGDDDVNESVKQSARAFFESFTLQVPGPALKL